MAVNGFNSLINPLQRLIIYVTFLSNACFGHKKQSPLSSIRHNSLTDAIKKARAMCNHPRARRAKCEFATASKIINAIKLNAKAFYPKTLNFLA